MIFSKKISSEKMIRSPRNKIVESMSRRTWIKIQISLSYIWSLSKLYLNYMWVSAEPYLIYTVSELKIEIRF
jgi:hypothetical protein